jgi:glycolate oxidase FAD binding subunit
VRPAWIAEPADEQEVAGILRSAEGQGLSVIPRGGGTKINWGNRPARADVVLSTRRLNRVLDHAWADLTVTVEAGCTIAALQKTLHVHGQRVAIDPLWPDRATVGGILSANDSGALRLRFGGLRDLIIGATIGLPDGTLASSGGKVVKNVAGYDLPKLVTGALGTLGVITRAVFRLHPLPQESRTLTCPVGRVDAALQAVHAVQNARLAHTSLQIRASALAPAVVVVRFEGSEAGNRAQIGQLAALTGEEWMAPASGDESVWNAREELWAASGSVLKISVLPTDLAGAIEAVGRAAAGAPWRAVAYATGLLWMQVDETSPAGLVPSIRSFAERRGGSAVVLRPAMADVGDDAWGGAPGAHGLMTAVKRQFDPHLTLNPGRFVGGL